MMPDPGSLSFLSAGRMKLRPSRSLRKKEYFRLKQQKLRKACQALWQVTMKRLYQKTQELLINKL